MNIFRTFLKILNKYKFSIILYTIILIFFAGFNTKNNDNSYDFTASKPDVLIINKDEDKGITHDFINYIGKVMNIKSVDEEMIDDALFYRDVNYIVYIKEGFRESLLEGRELALEVKSTGDYQASLAQMLVERYLKLAKISVKIQTNEEEIIKLINDSLTNSVEVEVMSKLEVDSLNKMTAFYNFTNYTVLASLMQVVCIVIASFKEVNVNKRIIISAKNYKKFNRELLFSNMTFAFLLWIFYVVLSIVLIGSSLVSFHGLLLAINLLVFVMLALVISFLIANIISDKGAIGGVVNVVALGSSFLCGAFVPMEFLPKSVLNIAHILPSYWFIKNNELIKTMEVFNSEVLKSFTINLVMLVLFIIIFISINNIITKKKRVIN